MTRKSNIKLTVSLAEGRRQADTAGNSLHIHSDSDSPECSPARAERKPLKVEFAGMEDLEKNSHKHEVERDLCKISRKGTGSVRYNQPRLSLLGKPLTYRGHKKDVKYRRLQARIYNFLERPKMWPSVIYHVLT